MADSFHLAIAACEELDQIVRKVGLVQTDPHLDPHRRNSIRRLDVALLPDLKLRLFAKNVNCPMVRFASRCGLLTISPGPITRPCRPVDR